MTEQQQYRLRVMYGKHGRLAMLSHLEVADALRRAVRRANLPFAVSQGFSPHMKMTFSAALPVGVGSESEIFDLMLTERVPEDAALKALQQASVPDLMVTHCKYVGKKEPAASVAYPVARYLAVFDGDASTLAFPDQITVVRAGKKPKTQVVADYLRGQIETQGPVMVFSVEALKTGSLRPDNLLRAALEEHNATTQQPLKLISCTRIDQCDLDGRSLVRLVTD